MFFFVFKTLNPKWDIWLNFWTLIFYSEISLHNTNIEAIHVYIHLYVNILIEAI